MDAEGRRPAGAPQRRDAGFLLLEAVIAFAIAALVLAALVQGALVGLRASRQASLQEEALARARSRLAALEATPLAASDRRGEDGGGFRWRVRILPLANSGPVREPVAEARPGLTLYAVSVAVGWREGGQAHEVRLDTQRLGLAAAPVP